MSEDLNKRERRVLEAVIRTYVETAEPAGSRQLSRRFGLGISPATIRNTMSDLEEKGFLFHPHTSAGRIPTNKAYRLYVDSLLGRPQPLAVSETDRLAEGITNGAGGGIGGATNGSAIETILRRAAQTLGVLTQELGVALGPRLDRSVLRRLNLVPVSTDRMLMVLSLDGGLMRTVYVEVAGEIADTVLTEVTTVLNDRLAGLTLEQIRVSLPARVRDTTGNPATSELLNIFVQEADQLFDSALPMTEGHVVLGQTSVLAEQPEFSAAGGMRRLLELTERPQTLADAFRRQGETPGLSITIGGEHRDPRLEEFTVVTSEYRSGSVTGFIGVIGPTRMPYEKVISLVTHTSRLVSDLLD